MVVSQDVEEPIGLVTGDGESTRGLSPAAAAVFGLLSVGMASNPHRLRRDSELNDEAYESAVEELVRAGMAVRVGARIAGAAYVAPARPDARPRRIAIDELPWPSSPGEALLGLPPVIALIVADADERAWQVLSARFAIDGDRQSLRDLRNGFALSHQGVANIETKALGVLRTAIRSAEGIAHDYEWPEPWGQWIRELLSPIADSRLGIVFEEPLLDGLVGTGRTRARGRAALALLYTSAGYTSASAGSTLGGIWGAPSSVKRYAMAAKHLHDTMTREHLDAMSAVQLTIAVNKRQPDHRLTAVEIEGLLASARFAETVSGGARARSEWITRPVDRVYRILLERGEPMHLDDLVRNMNASPGRSTKLVDRNPLRNALLRDDRFAPIGRSSIWKLATWTEIPTETILPLMQKGLSQLNRPATSAEIHEVVSSWRVSVPETSITMYLQFRRDIFRPIGRRYWALASWRDVEVPSDDWGQDRIADFVERWFRQRGSKSAAFSDLREGLTAASGLPSRSAAHLLAVNPAVRVERDGWHRIAHFIPRGQREDGKKHDGRRRKPLQSDLVGGRARELLLHNQDGILLRDLVSILARELELHPYVVRGHLSRTEDLNTVGQAGSRLLIVRLRDPFGLAALAADIPDASRRESARAALNLLNEQYVDVGLFLLSRQFENALRAYLREAGIVDPEVPESKPWPKLDVLITAARKNHLITDEGHLHYLRYERNERGHGEEPPLDERRAMLADRQRLAGTYLRYIELLESRRASLNAAGAVKSPRDTPTSAIASAG